MCRRQTGKCLASQQQVGDHKKAHLDFFLFFWCQEQNHSPACERNTLFHPGKKKNTHKLSIYNFFTESVKVDQNLFGMFPTNYRVFWFFFNLQFEECGSQLKEQNVGQAVLVHDEDSLHRPAHSDLRELLPHPREPRLHRRVLLVQRILRPEGVIGERVPGKKSECLSTPLQQVILEGLAVLKFCASIPSNLESHTSGNQTKCQTVFQEVTRWGGGGRYCSGGLKGCFWETSAASSQRGVVRWHPPQGNKEFKTLLWLKGLASSASLP